MSSFWPFSVTVILHFILALTDHPFAKKEKLPYLIKFLYLPALVITGVLLAPDAIMTVMYEPGPGFV